jgi:hypothetical protein
MNRVLWSLSPGLLALGAAGAVWAASDAAQIRQVRATSNAGIAAHESGPATSHLVADARILGSGGGTLDGVPAMRAAFEQNFADPVFVTYVRTPSTVEIYGKVAAETGRWRGVWKDREVSGRYLARWEMTPAGWRARSETYIPTACKGHACPR